MSWWLYAIVGILAGVAGLVFRVIFATDFLSQSGQVLSGAEWIVWTIFATFIVVGALLFFFDGNSLSVRIFHLIAILVLEFGIFFVGSGFTF